MKRINILISILIASWLVSCSQPSFQDKAETRCQQHFMDIFKDRYASVNLKQQKLMFSGDSICIIQYVAVVESYSGKTEEQRMEYVLVWSRDETPILREFTYPVGGSDRALQDDLIRSGDIFKMNVSKDNPMYEKHLRTEVVIRHILDPGPFNRVIKE